MTETGAVAQAVRAIVVDLEGVRSRLLQIIASLPAPPDETDFPEGTEELGNPAGLRSILECVLADCIEPAIRDLAAATAT